VAGITRYSSIEVEMASRQVYRVVDRAALAEIVARIVEAGGGQARAAAELKIGQPQVSKMLNQRIGALSDRTFRQLSRRCPSELRGLLQATVLDQKAIQAIRHYQSWLHDQLAQYHLQENERLVATFHRPAEAVYFASRVPLVTSGYTRGDLNPPWPTREDKLVAVLLDNHDYRKTLRDFAARVHKRLGSSPETEIRIRLSLCRVVAPLIAGWATMNIERTAEELHDTPVPSHSRNPRKRHKDERTELLLYLEHALAAEEILLRREPYFSRAQAAHEAPEGANRLKAVGVVDILATKPQGDDDGKA
jgi:predicted transcriptional regulator